MRIKKLTSLLLVLCLTLALGSIASLAVDLDTVSLTVAVSDNFADEAEANDFNEAGVVVDLYQVASAAPVEGQDTYEFVYSTAPYNTLETEKEWAELAQDAAKLTFDNSVTPTVAGVAVGSTVTDGLTAGLYLVIAHGAEDEDYVVDGDAITTIARSDATEYSFSPQLIALPTKADGNEDGIITTTEDDGEWINDPTLTLKYSRAGRFGSLIINKTVNGFDGEPATFVFHVTAEGYDNYASIYFTGGATASVRLDKLPAGEQVTVTEEYSGARYNLTASDGTAVIPAGDAANVYFTNTRNNSGVGGSGINNNFTFDGSDWPLAATPAQG